MICIAPNYRKYDLHAVRVMGAGLELWTYRLFENDVIYLEEVFQKSDPVVGAPDGAKNPVMVAAPAGRGTEVDLACNILNQMTVLGRPMSYRIGR